MIEKVGAISPKATNFKVQKLKLSSSVSNSFNKTQLSGANLAEYFKATRGVSFRGLNGKLTKLEASIIGESEIRIPNLLDINEDIILPRKDMPNGKEYLNAAGLNVIISSDNEFKTYDITNDKGYELAVVKYRKSAQNMPIITYKQGKYMPELTIKDPSLDGKAIKMLAGSEIKAQDFRIVMPGQYEPRVGTGYKNVSFTGNVAITTLNKEDRTLNAVDKYNKSGLQENAIQGDYVDVIEKYQPTIVIPAGGLGERFKNITRERENKPSAKLPTDDNYRIIGTTLNLAASCGVLNGDDSDNIIYLSQRHEIPENKNTYWIPEFETDGGAIAEGLRRDLIANDKDVIILNADIFTNADVTRAYAALKTLPDAALVIPYYPVNPQRAKAFGLLGIKKDENENLQIVKFVEKPDYTNEAPDPNDFTQQGDYDSAMKVYDNAQMALNPEDEETFLANPGMYFLSKEAAKILMAKGVITPKETKLGDHIMPAILKLIEENKLVDKDGNIMKAYTLPLERKGGKPAVWDDIGTAEAYLKLIKDVACEVRKNGTGVNNKYYGIPEFVMEDFEQNVDLESGIVFDSMEAQYALANFIDNYSVDDIYGNIFVAGK